MTEVKADVAGLKEHATRMDRNMGAIMRHLGVDETGES
jgi:hypothetical protein